jgi:uncharacterized protein YdaU (DUF1376 family)
VSAFDGFDWYARCPRRALRGMQHLNLELRGAYCTLLEMIYDRGEAVQDDDKFIAGWMGVTVRKWRMIRAELLRLNRIIIVEGRYGRPALSDEYAEAELKEQARRHNQLVDAAHQGGVAKAEKTAKSAVNGVENGELKGSAPNENSDLGVPQRHRHTPQEANASFVGATDLFGAEPPQIVTPPPKRGSRLPEDWTPSPSERHAALIQGLTDEEIDSAAANFQNFWCARAGKDATKLSWPRTWANRVAELAERKREAGRRVATRPSQPPGRNGGDVSFADLLLRDLDQPAA